MHDTIQLARQPILDSRLTLRGYELLARDCHGQLPRRAGSINTASVLVNALAEFGLDAVVGTTPAYVNVTREFIVGALPLPLPPERVVLEVLEDVEPDEGVLKGLRALRERGFKIAVDDYRGERPGYDPILACCDVVKVDCQDRGPDEIAEILRGLAGHSVRLLAEKVERPADFRSYQALGFHLFQGYFFAQPDVLKGRVTPVDRANLIHLLAELQNPDHTPDALQQVLARDSALALKLVRYLNSVHMGLTRRIDSLREVVVYLGSEAVRNIACLLLISRVADKARQLMVCGMVRARMCEELARARGLEPAARAFTAGLFSTLDAVLDRDLREVLVDLPLAEEVATALLRREGPLGELLETVVAHERAEWDRSPPEAPDVQRAYLSALTWVDAVERELVGSA